ncbi:ATP-binding protein [Micromonospora sp. NPDC049679]|uniref:ATP-binding protein n=1 Tax=Micromonospora sp. NPDC049679 TaxID=3155920 RepID=UPI003402D840
MSKQPPVYDVEFSLAAAYTSVAEARRYVRGTLAVWPFAGCHDDVELVVSELVGNALRHGRGRPVLRLSGMRDWLRVEVLDDSEVLPQPRSSGADGGWGLHLIERLSATWGADHRDGGKAVWCELQATPNVIMGVAEAAA